MKLFANFATSSRKIAAEYGPYFVGTLIALLVIVGVYWLRDNSRREAENDRRRDDMAATMRAAPAPEFVSSISPLNYSPAVVRPSDAEVLKQAVDLSIETMCARLTTFTVKFGEVSVSGTCRTK